MALLYDHGLQTLPSWIFDMETQFEYGVALYWTWHRCTPEPFLVHTSIIPGVDRSCHYRIRGVF